MTIDRLQLLCGKGYFPSALPPTFTTRDFGRDIRPIMKEWATSGYLDPDFRKAAVGRKIPSTEPETLSVPKGLRERRYLSLVHPRSQAVLADLISRHWNSIETWISRSRYTYDKVRIVDGARRAIAEPQFVLHKAHKESIASVARWLLETDVTRFYPSIYTHSIAWAAHGKDVYKRNPKQFYGGLADQLDVAVRKCNRDQTVGIPIGPDTSWVIAEVISSYVDQTVFRLTSCPRDEADRLQDDWLVGSKSLEEAEARLSGIVRAYQEVGLDIHGRKTGISHIRDIRNPTWRGQILALTSGKTATGERLAELLRTSLTLQIDNPHEAVLSYVFGVLDGMRFRPQDLPHVQSFITRAVAVDPRVMDRACILLLNLKHEGLKIDEERVAHRFVPLVEEAMETGHTFEAIWGLHLFRGLRMNLGTTRIEALAATSDNPSLLLILLDLESQGLIGNLPKKRWLKQIAASNLNDPIWLLAYEGVRHGWLVDPQSKLRNNPFLKPMFDRDVVFYDPKRNVPNRKRRRSGRLKARRAQWRLALAEWFQY